MIYVITNFIFTLFLFSLENVIHLRSVGTRQRLRFPDQRLFSVTLDFERG